MWNLIDHVVPIYLPSVHEYLPSGFNGMDDILTWFKGHNDYDVYSFDIFDTLLRRRIDPPEQIKCLVAEHISELMAIHGNYVSAEFVLAKRNKAEEVLRQEAVSRGRDSQCYLIDIINMTLEILKAEGVLNSTVILEYEMDLEKKAIELMPGATAVLKYLKSLNKRIIGISETYLSSDQLGEILEHHGLEVYIDKLYVSSDEGKSKATGELFKCIVDNEGRSIVHVGDQYTLDNVIPRRLGIKTLWFHSKGERKRKKKLRRLINSKNNMNYVNAIVGRPNEGKSGLYHIGYEVLGPALTVFIHDVAEQAKKDGIETLFFVARDGYVLKKIYEKLQRSVYANCVLPPAKYICLSRFPVRSASLHKFGQVELYMSKERFLKKDIKLVDILRSYGLDPNHFDDIAKKYQVDINGPIREPMCDITLHKLLDSNEFQDAVKTKSEEARRLLQDYLVSIGFMGKRKVALVDANVEGLTQSLLYRAFSIDNDFPALQGYYFSVVRSKLHQHGIDMDSSEMKGIVSDWRRDPEDEWDNFARFGILIELFSHPNHGVTVGYKKVNGKVMPIFRKTAQESLYHLTSQGLQGILCYARDYGVYYSLHNYRSEVLLGDVRIDVKNWMRSPPKRDAQALKGLFLTCDWPEESNKKIVNQITIIDMITVIGLIRKASSALHPQATLALAPLPRLSRLLHKAATCWYGSFKTISRILLAQKSNKARTN